MATRTTYLNLIKPDYSDAADIADINANMDTLDNTIQGLDETGSKSLAAHNNATDAHRAMQATVDDTLVPTADLNTIHNLLSNLGNRIKAATGASGWKGNPATTLASLATLVSNLSSGSDVTWSGKKFTNTKLGISGVIDTNGYVSFGPNFGGLIIQWGYFKENEWCTLPIAFTKSLITLANHESANVNTAENASYVCTTVINENKIYIYTPVNKSGSSNAFVICH